MNSNLAASQILGSHPFSLDSVDASLYCLLAFWSWEAWVQTDCSSPYCRWPAYLDWVLGASCLSLKFMTSFKSVSELTVVCWLFLVHDERYTLTSVPYSMPSQFVLFFSTLSLCWFCVSWPSHYLSFDYFHPLVFLDGVNFFPQAWSSCVTNSVLIVGLDARRVSFTSVTVLFLISLFLALPAFFFHYVALSDFLFHFLEGWTVLSTIFVVSKIILFLEHT